MKIVHPKPLKTIVSAISKYTQFIAPTYGPAGQSTLIALNSFNIKSVDDGHETSKEYELENEFENAIISFVKEATDRTNSRVGDGTTTAVILTGAIVGEVTKDSEDVFANKNYTSKALEIRKGAKEAVEYIKSKSKKVKTKAELHKIAYNSYNNEAVATLISDTLFKIGEEGLLSIEDSQGVTTEVEIVKGLETDKGHASPYFITNDKEECVIDNPSVVITSKRIESFSQISDLIDNLVKSGQRHLLIIADGFSDEVLTKLVLYRFKGILNGPFYPLAIEASGFGNKEELLKDICAMTGATLIDSNIVTLENIQPKHLGSAKKVISQKTKTTIIDGAGSVTERVSVLNKQLEIAGTFDKDQLKKRIASLQGGIALIKVGANTESEQKTIKAKVEDAVNATKIAFKDGIVKGAGRMYEEIKTSSTILNMALKAPRKQLEENGIEYLDDNVTDPAGVLIAALETAVSIACGLITIGGIITTKREKKDNDF